MGVSVPFLHRESTDSLIASGQMNDNVTTLGSKANPSVSVLAHMNINIT